MSFYYKHINISSQRSKYPPKLSRKSRKQDHSTNSDYLINRYIVYNDRSYEHDTNKCQQKEITFKKDENIDNEFDYLFKKPNTGINFNKYEDLKVEVEGDNSPSPIKNFSKSGLHDRILSNIKLCRYEIPTPVQKYAIPIILSKRDLLASAQTGSGKTASFLLPMIHGLLEEKFQNECLDPHALILAPTRELAQQIHSEAIKFTRKTGLKAICIYGGVSIQPQIFEVKNGCDILIATPGRLNDILDRSLLSLSRIKYLCFDEADRLLDRGFEPQIREIVEFRDMPPSEDRITMLFSASFPDIILRLAKDFMKDYLFLKVGEVGSTTDNITQTIVWAESYEKERLLIKELKRNPKRTLVFVERKIQVDDLRKRLLKNGFKAAGIHGDIRQPQREASLNRFRTGKIPILIATSIAARGLDIENVSHIINYDLPSNIDEYVHRIGRTGRAGNTGTATAFFNENNLNIAPKLIDILEESKQDIPSWLYEYKNYWKDRTYNNVNGYKIEDFDDFGGLVGDEDEWD